MWIQTPNHVRIVWNIMYFKHTQYFYLYVSLPGYFLHFFRSLQVSMNVMCIIWMCVAVYTVDRYQQLSAQTNVHEYVNSKLSSGWKKSPYLDHRNILNEISLLQERESLARRQMLEEERRRREDAEKRLQDETFHRQQLVEREVKMRSKNFSQVSEMRHNWVCMPERWKIALPTRLLTVKLLMVISCARVQYH